MRTHVPKGAPPVKGVWPWPLLGGLAVVYVSITALMGLNVWKALGISIVALVANGMFATLADNYLVEFSKPGTGHNPKFVRAAAWFVRAMGMVCVVMIVVLMSLWAFA